MSREALIQVRRHTFHQAARAKMHKREDGKEVITGYAAVFYRAGDAGTEYEMWKGYKERILPGAFNNVIQSNDARALFNHDSNIVLGRNSAGTLRLSVDSIGLKYEIDPPETQWGKDVQVSLRRNDVTGSSFMFDMYGEGGRIAWVQEGDTEIREIQSVAALWDVGPVTFPAYEGTSAGMRSNDLEALRAEIEAERKRRIQLRTSAAAEAVRVKARCLTF